MSGSTTKKVLVRRFERETLAGFVNPQAFVQPGGVELLKPDGAVAVLPYPEVKTVFFVREFDSAEEQHPLRVFNSRPKIGGLWVRMRFRDGELMEGILINDLLRLEPFGFMIVPPDPTFTQQRVFIPKAALESCEVLGVVGSPLGRRKPKPPSEEQIGLFEK